MKIGRWEESSIVVCFVNLYCQVWQPCAEPADSVVAEAMPAAAVQRPRDSASGEERVSGYQTVSVAGEAAVASRPVGGTAGQCVPGRGGRRSVRYRLTAASVHSLRSVTPCPQPL